jgi:hypothetical protein
MLLRLLLIIFMLLTGSVSNVIGKPFDARKIFYSDIVLRKAIADIAQMREPELRTFAHYLSECDDTEGATARVLSGNGCLHY